MANIFERLRDWVLAPLMSDTWSARKVDTGMRRQYRRGVQRLPLKSTDDNMIVNFVGLVVARSVSYLFGKEPKFILDGGASQDHLDTVWKFNKKMKLLKQLATYGGEAGTCYIKILPDALLDGDGNLIPRLVAIDPAMVEITTEAEDVDTVIRYTLAWTAKGKNQAGQEIEVAYKQEITREMPSDPGVPLDDTIEEVRQDYIWVARKYQGDGSRWQQVGDDIKWEYEFPPIMHWQNMPENGTPYGQPDITDDLILLQDRLNFVISNTAKIIRHHAHPKTWGKMFTTQTNASWGADEMLLSTNPEAMLQNLEMHSDLGSSLSFIRFIRQAMFDIARSVDIDSLADKLGSLTNFGLKVLYQDAMSKLDDKRGSYGEAIVEINHRLLELASLADTDGGRIEWPDVLPVNEKEETDALKTDVELGLVSKETASGLRGYDYDQEKEKLENEQAAGDNIGAALMRAMTQGNFAGTPEPGTQVPGSGSPSPLEPAPVIP